MILKVNKDICEIKQNEVWNVGDYNVHTVQVELSEEFDGLVNKVRYFIEDNSYDMLITDNVAQVPYEATVMEGTIKIGVYGYDADTNILVQSTSPVNKYISSGTYTGEADNTEPLTPTDKEQIQTAIQKNTNDITDLKENKQDKLISGVNIKTINNESILSGGNLTLVAEETDPIFTNSPAYSITDNDITYWNNKANMSDIPDVSNFITKDVDDLTYYTKSTDMQIAINNAVGNERTAIQKNADDITDLKANKQDTLISGTNIKTINNTSLLGEGNITIEGGGGGGTSDYADLTNKPKINNVELKGNKTSSDLGLITNAVDDLVNYYKKSETFTKQEVNNLISAITTMDIQVVQTLPVQDISTTTIYLVPKTTAEQNDAYDEYIYVSNAWEHIGSTEVDLTNYVTNTDYATAGKGGTIRISNASGLGISNGNLYAVTKAYNTYSSASDNMFIGKGTLENVITGKGLVSNTDFGSSSTAGVFRTNGTYGTTRTSSGVLYGVGKTYAEYTSSPTQLFISKGTLENVVAGKELDLKQLSTFDSTKTQVLKNINGTLTWVDES